MRTVSDIHWRPEILARGGDGSRRSRHPRYQRSDCGKHYAKWSDARQQRITKLFQAVYPGTYAAREKRQRNPLILKWEIWCG